MDEEVVLLEEQVAALQADVEALQSRLADAESLARDRDVEATHVRQQLAERDSAATALAEELASLREVVTAAREQERATAGRYRQLLLAGEPELPADLVSGATVAEIDATAERARQTVSQVRQQFEARAQAARVPAGAPARAAADTSSLSPAEKIRLGLRQG